MAHYINPNGCSGTPQGNERRVVEMGYDKTERAILTIARLYFLTFSDPCSHAWMRAAELARTSFDEPRATYIAACVLQSVNELRAARSSAFEFSNPECPGCSLVLCESERQYMGALTATRLGRKSAAHASAMLLCEGGDSAPLLATLGDLSELLTSAQTRADA
ncbi:MAG: hypothetical protein AAGA15_04390 [Pseudomonadota bacterium]